MYGLPKATERNNQLGKDRVFAKFKVNSADQQAFNADIVTMFITNFIDVSTVPALKPAKDDKGIYVLTLNLRNAGCKAKNLELLAKMIQQKIIFALCTGDKVQFAVYYEKKLYATTFIKQEDAKLALDGTTIEEVWENLIKCIGGIVVEGENTLAEQVEVDAARIALINKINTTREKAIKERQPRRKKELIDLVKSLEMELNTL